MYLTLLDISIERYSLSYINILNLGFWGDTSFAGKLRMRSLFLVEWKHKIERLEILFIRVI